jgi:adenylate cyclase
MPSMVFISHSSKDRASADTICAHFESAGIKCWIAPRDIEPGATWTKGIMQGLDACRVLILVFSEHANDSDHVQREVAKAFSSGVAVIPFRIKDVLPNQSLSYFLDTVQWLDASAPPLEKHLGTLSERVKKLLVEGEGKAGLDAKRPAMQTAPRGETPDTRRRLAALSAGVAALLIVAAAGGWYVLGGRLIKPAQAAHLSVVVLPFTNLSGDPSQDYFADGVTENLTTDLSRIRNSFVIARNTAFTYKGKSIDAKAIGKELGVRYVLEGSVQRAQNRVRVNAQLIDAESGAHIWADRFEADMADLFKLQDQVVAQLANALRYALGMAEAAKASNVQNPDAIDLAMRGWALLPLSLPSKDQADAARPLFEQALKIDPDNSEALAGKAQTTIFEYVYAPMAGTDYDAAILGPVDRAIALDRGNIHAYRTKGQYLAVSGRPDDAVRAFDAGLAINPNAAGLLAMRGNAEDYLRRFEQAKSDIQQAMLLSPCDPAMGQWFNLRADTELGLGRFDEALEDAKKAIEGGHRVFYTYLNLAVAHAFKGEMDEAKAATTEARRLKPDLSIKWLLKHKPVLQFAFDGLRKAGLPEE